MVEVSNQMEILYVYLCMYNIHVHVHVCCFSVNNDYVILFKPFIVAVEESH